MGQITDLKGKALELLRADPRFVSFRLVGEFAGNPRALPVEKPTLAVGVDRVEAAPGALGGYLGESEGLSHTGLMAEITLRFDCWLPMSADIAGAHAVFEALCEILTGELGAEKVWLESAAAEERSLATYLRAKASLTVCLGRGESAPPMGDIILRRVT